MKHAGQRRAQALGPLALVILALVATGCADNSTHPTSHLVSRDLVVTEDAVDIHSLQIEAVNGTVTLSSTKTSEVRASVRVEVRADSRQEAADFIPSVRIMSTWSPRDPLLLRESYPEPPRGVVVETFWNVTIPQGLSLEVEVVNGDLAFIGDARSVEMVVTNGNLTVRGTAGPLSLLSTNGTVTTSLEELIGDLTAATVNGTHTLAFREGTGSVASSLVNGTIRVVLPGGYAGELDARTSNGVVSCTIPLTATETLTETEIRGTLGAGGVEDVTLQTVNGTITITETGS